LFLIRWSKKISVFEALKAYTINAAYSSFDENVKGVLVVGKLADFVILNQDILSIPADMIKDVMVLKTFVGGSLVYEAN